MELALKTGAFETLDKNEMLAVDGGVSWNDVGLYVSGAAGGALGAAACAGIGAKKGGTVGAFLGGPGGAAVGAIVGGAIGIIVYSLWD